LGAVPKPPVETGGYDLSPAPPAKTRLKPQLTRLTLGQPQFVQLSDKVFESPSPLAEKRLRRRALDAGEAGSRS